MKSVGERAVALCPRPAHVRGTTGGLLVDCFGSQWAGSDERVGAVLAGCGTVEPLFECRWASLGVRDWIALPRSLDYLSLDVVYLVRPGGVRVSLPVWLGIPAADGEATEPTDGLLVEVSSLAELRVLRARIRDLKGLFGVAVDAERLSSPEARACLLATLSVVRRGEPPATYRSTTDRLP